MEKTAKPRWPIGAALAEISKLSRTLFLIWMALFALPGWKQFTAANQIPMAKIYVDACAFGFLFGLFFYAANLMVHGDGFPAFSFRLLPRLIMTIILKLIQYSIVATVAAFLLGFFAYPFHHNFLLYVWGTLTVVFIVTHVVGKHLARKRQTASPNTETHTCPDSPPGHSTTDPHGAKLP
ncbi:hypothetical protein [Ethanoligenens sp.]|uniref:hypothetical protein n=1 Tax=Ethanoligenens sp. TaxID=2099655 RepID=UPI0039E733B4